MTSFKTIFPLLILVTRFVNFGILKAISVRKNDKYRQ